MSEVEGRSTFSRLKHVLKIVKHHKTHVCNQMHANIGTEMYKAPEIGHGKYSTKVDMWALGIMYYRMLFGISPKIPLSKDPGEWI